MYKIKSALLWCIETTSSYGTNILEITRYEWCDDLGVKLGGDVYDDDRIYMCRRLGENEMKLLVDILTKLDYEIIWN